jgi:cytochrome c biogenesis protein CcdA/thiol-disulfide isomerase/thioredoxin
MILFLLAYVGGVLTIVSPCILPVLPFVFARSDQPFVRSGLPLLFGMAVTFAGVATLAAVGGGWAVQANAWGRYVAIVLLAVFGLTLLFPHLSDRLTRPLVALGSRLSESASDASQRGSSIVPSFLLGIATGLLWAPCAGPILGLVLTGAALSGASARTSLLLLAYALGAATSLGIALLIGGRVFTAMKKSLGASEWIRRVLGVLLLCGVAAIALGLDTGVLTKLSLASTSKVEQSLVDQVGLGSEQVPASAAALKLDALPVEGQMPSLDGAVEWINSPPLSAEALKGKVVLVDFWTYSCINCLRALPYVRAWADKYKDQGLVVIGVHAPEFAFEKEIPNVKKAVADLHVDYPVAIDNNYAIWRAFKNHYWPAHYFIDAKGQIRHHHFGEGEYAQSEQVIQQLLREAGHPVGHDVVALQETGAQAAPDMADVKSPESYIGYARAERFSSAGGEIHDARHGYVLPPKLDLNQWGLGGDWTVQDKQAIVDAPGARIAFEFHARDLHLVLGQGSEGKKVRIRVLIDGHAPGDDHGVDIDANGNGVVDSERLYQLIRQHGAIADHRLEIEFLDSGAQAFAFTFG